MVKVSITLPNNTQITFESEEPEVIHQIVQMALGDLPRELMSWATSNGAPQPATPDTSSNVTAHSPLATPTEAALPRDGSQVAPPPKAEASPPSPADLPVAPATPPPTIQPKEPTPPAATRPRPSSDVAPPAAERDFIQFCHSTNPLGDMRRVVVATEGASRFLGLDSIDAEELGRLFDLAGWRRPHSFVQALRNAARSKFRWLERIPGRSGHYTITALGRTIALGG